MGSKLTDCPHCGVSLIGGEIPADVRASGGYGDATHWKREIGHIEHDRVAYYSCPDCGGTWPRNAGAPAAPEPTTEGSE